jgi:hypothetical protein
MTNFLSLYEYCCFNKLSERHESKAEWMGRRG